MRIGLEASTKPVNEEVERVRTRLKEMELKAKAINSQTPGKDISGNNKASGGVNNAAGCICFFNQRRIKGILAPPPTATTP